MANQDNYRELNELVGISESRVFQNILDERRVYLQGEVNKFIRQKDWTEAYGALMRLDDIGKQIEIIKKRIFDIRKEQPND